MKNLILVLLIFISVQLFGQKESEPSSSLKDSNIAQFTSFFNNPIDLNIPSAKANYSDNQAKILVENFLKEASIKSYTTKHKGGGNGRPFFEIGILGTMKGNFRTYLLYQKSNETLKIIEFRIEQE
ncbi:DUF4783 domain-containing protein [Vicingaceae bacterium]|nr:DUF4783 domain-containing protein [Vicingaceae bacterium]MDC1451103.1 DUF4783 domain-containing protein [Vicingaceae bacterium]